MKLHPLCVCLTFCLAFCSCGGSDDQPIPAKPALPPDPDAATKPIERSSVTVKATEELQQIALERIEVMKQITAVLKPLRDPVTALTKEDELERLFAQYNQLGQQAADQGLKGRPLAALGNHLAPEEARDARAEFFMYLGLVRQLGQEQREMLVRAMGEDSDAAPAVSDDLQQHLKMLNSPAPSSPAPASGRRAQPAPSSPPAATE